jgi:hypothetical protein
MNLRLSTLIVPLMIPAIGSAFPGPLQSDQAGVVGGWSGPGVANAVKGIVLQEVVESDGCLRLSARSHVLADYQDRNRKEFSTVIRLKPGRYAISGVQWEEPWIDGYDMTGVSRPDGEMWTVEIAAGSIFDLGVWPVTSPFAHRYFAGDPVPDISLSEARKVAEGVGSLTTAKLERANVSEAGASCSATIVPAK